MTLPVVAVVGRPNVGKSTLFNKLIGKRLSIVGDTPGITRDRVYGRTEWRGRTALLVDTGGLEPDSGDFMLKQMRAQAEIAIGSAEVAVMVTDITTGVTAADREVAGLLRRSGKPVVLCVNKCDSIGDPPAGIYEFYSLGLGEPLPVSSVHGHGTGDLLDRIFENLPREADGGDDGDAVKVAIIGKPNAGKSSLINKISGEERVIVSETAGTTRDSVDTTVEVNGTVYNLIDTAGIRRRSKIDDKIEKYSVLRAELAVERSDVCVLLIDGAEGCTEQDAKIAGLAEESGKAVVIAVNKWDAVEKTGRTMDAYRREIMKNLAFLSYAPVVFISAKTGQRIDRLLALVSFVYGQSVTRIPTGRLNDLLSDAVTRVPPPSDRGRRLKIYYITQVSVKPPTFVCFCNSRSLFHFSYKRYIENQIRSVFGLEGSPIRIIIREREEGKN